MSAIILRGDAGRLPLSDESVDLIVTSPPFYALRDYQDGGESIAGQLGAEETPRAYVAALLECTREWMRVLKPSGSLFVNLGDKYSGAQQQTHGNQSAETSSAYWRRTDPKRTGIPAKSLYATPSRYAIGCVDELGLIERAEIIWSKASAQPDRAADRVQRSHEHLFHFTRARRYFHDAEAISDLPGSVWEMAAQPFIAPAHLGVDHRASFPLELPRRCILGWSPRGGVVLDPCGGTGATALVADVLGRTGISVDLSMDYGRLAKWRTSNPGERCRVIGAPKPPPQVDGQAELFGLGASA